MEKEKNIKYTWNDTVSVKLDNGKTISIKLSDVKENDFIGYICTSCGAGTTLANGNCGSCGNPFEVLDLEEAKSLFPSVTIKENNPERIAFLLIHKAWICDHCKSYNVNYPRDPFGEVTINCINCGSPFEENNDILLEDSDTLNSKLNSIDNFKDKILKIIENKKSENQTNRDNFYPKNSILTQNYSHKNSSNNYQKNKITSADFRNKIKILGSILGAGFIAYIINYGFIEEINKEITIQGHHWERIINIEEYTQQKGEGWEEKINGYNYDDFKIVDRISKKAPWDSYEVLIGTKTVTDTSNCLQYNSPSQRCTTNYTTLSTGVTVSSQSCYTPSKSCISYGTKQVPEYETRYRNHPYIYFSYMDWEITDRLKTNGDNKKPYWANLNGYNFDNTTIRKGQEYEGYYIKTYDNEGKTENIKLSIGIWKKLKKGETCPVKATRWGGIKTNSLIEGITKCN